MKTTQMQELATPFPSSLVKEAAPGRFGSYVPHSSVTERLLTIVGPFSYEVTEVIRGDAPAVIGKKGTKDSPKFPKRKGAVVGCLGTLTVTIDGKVVTITEVGDVDEPAMNNDGTNLKNASSDAIKRCAMRIGLGLHLWSQGSYFLDLQLDAAANNSEALEAEAVADALDGEIEQATTGEEK
ncbi:unnamed protein product [marine sediment metagenome]|uniref:Rad52/22 double-strand break repair protein n=1 Tax=marine sediment metagenome TaxID=412755 RepID=X0VJ58_9ZZZZ